MPSHVDPKSLGVTSGGATHIGYNPLEEEQTSKGTSLLSEAVPVGSSESHNIDY